MRVGIMTMHRIANYGSFMQALSLKYLLEELGHDVEFVDYRVDPDIENRANLKTKVRCILLNLKKQTVGAEPLNPLKRRSSIYDKFRPYVACNSMLQISNHYHFGSDVDCLVVGSDEVFNCTQPGLNVGYSLELFGMNNRANKVVSFAASFGSTTLQKLKNYGIDSEIGQLLNKFSAISLRDENSIKIVRAVSNIAPQMHVEPVLIGRVEQKNWKETELTDYIVLYGYEYRFTPSECRKILAYAKRINCKVVALGEKQHQYDIHICCRPDEVLSYFKNAKCIVTDTFHGTIFSVIEHRPFLTVIRTSKEGVWGNEEKIRSLMNTLGLNSRLTNDFCNIDEQMDLDIDYDAVDKIRSTERERAINYFQEVL